MNINTETITTMTEANQNFSKVAKVAENNGQAVIFKNNKPKFLLIDVDSNSYFDISDDEKSELRALTKEVASMQMSRNSIDFLYDDFIKVFRQTEYFKKEYLSFDEMQERGDKIKEIIKALYEGQV